MSGFSAIIDWAGANPMYAFGGLVGFALGIFYGFDGWRSSTEELELKDSPRVRNVLWVLGGAFSAIIGDIKAVDATAKKPVLLLIYFAAFLVGAIGVVVIWGIVVFVDAAQSSRLHRAYSTGDAVGDYFYFGYRKYRNRKAETASKQRANFVQDYLTQLTYSVAAAGSRISSEQRTSVARNLLRTISAIVLKYRGDNSKGQIRVNLMVLSDCSDELKQKLQFAPSPQQVDRCLELVAYDNDEIQRKLVLPLPKSGDVGDALPGAPTALLGDTPVIIDNTHNIDYPRSIAPKAKEAMQAYLASKESRFKSFASLRVVGAGEPIAVVNIECSELHVFGADEGEKKEIVEYLFPFCSILGILLTER